MSMIANILQRAGFVPAGEMNELRTQLSELETRLNKSQINNMLEGFVAENVRAYAAAQGNRLTADWVTVTGNPIADIRTGIKPVRDRSRDLVQNDPTGKHIVRTYRLNVPGPMGFTLQSKVMNEDGSEDDLANSIIERGWYDWCESWHCSANGRMSFRSIEHLITTQLVRDGEFLVRKRYKGKYGFQLQPLDPELIDETYNEQRGRNVVVCGVEIDPDGKPVTYWLRVPTPSDQMYGLGMTGTREPVSAAELYHGFDVEFASQTRGIGWMAPIMLRMKGLSDWEQFMWLKGKLTAAFGLFLKDQQPNNGGSVYNMPGRTEITADNKKGRKIFQVSPAMVQDIGDKDIVNWDPKFPAESHGEYVQSMEKRVGVGVGFSYPLVSGDMSQTNYSSARFGAINDQEGFRGVQQMLVEQFHKLVYRDWLEAALMNNQLTYASGKSLPFYKYDKLASGCKFIGRRWKAVDPLKDVMAVVVGLEYGLGTATHYLAENGEDLLETYQELQKEKQLRDQLGIATKLDALEQSFEALTNEKPGDPDSQKRFEANGKDFLKRIADILHELDERSEVKDNEGIEAAENKLVNIARQLLKQKQNGNGHAAKV